MTTPTAVYEQLGNVALNLRSALRYGTEINVPKAEYALEQLLDVLEGIEEEIEPAVRVTRAIR